jgi:uncharacterized protein (TIGR02145 family)
MYGGRFWTDNFGNQGNLGYFWSSTVSSATGAHSLYFSSTNVYPAGNLSKGNGFAVRCVAP